MIRSIRGAQAAFIREVPRRTGADRQPQQNLKTPGVRKATEQLCVQAQGDVAHVPLSCHIPHYFIDR